MIVLSFRANNAPFSAAKNAVFVLLVSSHWKNFWSRNIPTLENDLSRTASRSSDNFLSRIIERSLPFDDTGVVGCESCRSDFCSSTSGAAFPSA